MTINSYFSSAPRPGLPMTSDEYLAAFELPAANSCSWALPMSEPAMGAIPLNRPPDAVPQRHLRRVADLAPRAGRVERTALGEEVDAPAENRRLDAERSAGGLTGRASQPERPHRQMDPGPR